MELAGVWMYVMSIMAATVTMVSINKVLKSNNDSEDDKNTDDEEDKAVVA